MRINVAVPEANVSKHVLDAGLEAVTRLDESLLRDGAVPTAEQGIKQGVKWKPEPFDEEHFDHAGLIMRRGWGDCDDLAPWHAASLRHTGKDPEATAIVRRSGPKRWHAIVQRSDGSIDDPSKWAGMGQDQSVRGASLALMHAQPSVSGILDPKPSMAMVPFRGNWRARVDVPFASDPDYAMASLAAHQHPAHALVRAINGANKLAIASGMAQQAHIDRLCAIADHIDGVPLDAIAACYGDEHAAAAQQVVGSFFGKVKNLAKKVSRVAVPILKFVPGAGQALAALDLGSKAYNVAKNVLPTPKQLILFGVNPGHVPDLVRAGFPVVPG